MDSNNKEQQVEKLNKLWHELLQSNKLNVCTRGLEGATPLEVSILRVVAQNPDIILGEIGRKLNVVSSTLTSAVNRLEKRKLLYRAISSRDLRSFGLKLTEEGEEALSEHIKCEEEIIERMLDVFEDSRDRSEFIRLFDKLVNGIL